MGPSDKIQVVDYPYSLPSKCVICGGGPGNEDGRKYIDFNFQLDDYGAIYFCTFCIVNLAEAVDFIGPEAHFEVVNELEKWRLEAETLRAENEEFRRVYSTLRGLGAVPDDSDSNARGEHVSSQDDDVALPVSIPKPRSKGKGTDKSGSVEGSGDIPASDGDKSDGDADDLSF